MKSKTALHVLVNKKLPEEIKLALQKENFKVFETCKVNSLDAKIETHPDMQVHFLSKNCAVCAPEVHSYYQKILPKNITLYKGDRNLSVTYPGDCAYNIARMGGYAFGNLKAAAPMLQKLYHSYGIPFLHINQGYAKCNICIVNDHAIITEDQGIRACLSKIEGIDCLYLQPGEVLIEGFPYGFIGGATGSIDNCVYFCGSLSNFSQKDKVFVFLEKHHASFVELSASPLEDYGSLFFF